MRVGAEGGTRTPTGCPIRPSNVRVYQFHHFGTFGRLICQIPDFIDTYRLRLFGLRFLLRRLCRIFLLTGAGGCAAGFVSVAAGGVTAGASPAGGACSGAGAIGVVTGALAPSLSRGRSRRRPICLPTIRESPRR